MNRNKHLTILKNYLIKKPINNVYQACASVAKILGYKEATYPIKNKYLNLFFDIEKFSNKFGLKLEPEACSDWKLNCGSLGELFQIDKDFITEMKIINRN